MVQQILGASETRDAIDPMLLAPAGKRVRPPPLQPPRPMNTRALATASLVGTLLQVAMVVAGHSSPAIAGMFAVGGMGISLIAGVIYARLARDATKRSAAIGGLASGAICAFLGILVSHLLGDVPASLLALGTLSSAVTGAIGGLLGTLGARRVAAA